MKKERGLEKPTDTQEDKVTKEDVEVVSKAIEINRKLEETHEKGIGEKELKAILQDLKDIYQKEENSKQIIKQHHQEYLEKAYGDTGHYVEQKINYLYRNNPNNPNKSNKSNNPNNPNIISLINDTQDISDSDRLKAQLLSSERPNFKQFKGGIHQNKYYVGTSLWHTESNRFIDVILTSDKNIYYNHKDENQIREDYDMHYTEGFNYEALDNHISVKGIRRYIGGKKANIKSLFKDLIQLNKSLMYYPEDIMHSLVALDIISTYFLPLWEAKGRRFIHAEKGSGKTRQCDILNNLCCNSVKSPDTTKSSFYRLMEGTVWTLIIDDFDSIGEEQKTDVLQHYKTGYKPGSKTLRTKDNKQRSIQGFNNYGHVIMNNTRGLDDISQDRTVPIDIVKSDGDVTEKQLDFDDPLWQKITDDLYICALNNWKNIKETYDKIESKTLRGRQLEITRDILAIAQYIDPDLRKKVESFYSQRLKQRDYEELQSKREFLALYPFMHKEENHDPIPLKDITIAVLGQIKPEITDLSNSNDKLRRHKRGYGKFLGEYYEKFSSIFKKSRPNNRVHMQLKNKEALEKYLESKGWNDKETYEDLLTLF